MNLLNSNSLKSNYEFTTLNNLKEQGFHTLPAYRIHVVTTCKLENIKEKDIVIGPSGLNSFSFLSI